MSTLSYALVNAYLLGDDVFLLELNVVALWFVLATFFCFGFYLFLFSSSFTEISRDNFSACLKYRTVIFVF